MNLRQVLLGLPEPVDRPLDPLADGAPVEILLPAIEQIALWLMRQAEYPCKRRLDDDKAVEWAGAGFSVSTRRGRPPP